MSVRLGVGIITYNRAQVVAETVARVLAHTRHPFALAVADDGSEDGTAERLREKGVQVVSGRNMGIAWNKNRALFYLIGILSCDVVILLEDNSRPNQDGWERESIEGTRKWGHNNFTGDWFDKIFLRGHWHRRGPNSEHRRLCPVQRLRARGDPVRRLHG